MGWTRPYRRWFAVAQLSVAASVVLSTQPAAGQDAAPNAENREAPAGSLEARATHFRVDYGLLGARLDDAGYAVGFEAAGLFQWHGLLVGADAALETQALALVSTFTRTAGAATVGIALRPLAYLQLDVLGEIGLAYYSGVGSAVLVGGTSATVPFAGGRAGLSVVLPSSRGLRVSFGLWGRYDDDLERRRVTFSDATFFGTSTRTVTVGTQRVALLLGPSITF